jgi:hypothetical protein
VWCQHVVTVCESGRTDIRRGGDVGSPCQGGCKRSTNDRNFVFF